MVFFQWRITDSIQRGGHTAEYWLYLLFLFVFTDWSTGAWSQPVPPRTEQSVLPCWSVGSPRRGTWPQTDRHHRAVPGLRSWLHCSQVMSVLVCIYETNWLHGTEKQGNTVKWACFLVKTLISPQIIWVPWCSWHIDLWLSAHFYQSTSTKSTHPLW